MKLNPNLQIVDLFFGYTSWGWDQIVWLPAAWVSISSQAFSGDLKGWAAGWGPPEVQLLGQVSCHAPGLWGRGNHSVVQQAAQPKAASCEVWPPSVVSLEPSTLCHLWARLRGHLNASPPHLHPHQLEADGSLTICEVVLFCRNVGADFVYLARLD